MRIAIIGTGVAGLTCAHRLAPHHDVTVFEAEERPGGHAHTVSVDVDGTTHAVDTGFIVFNERNYPIFSRLLDELGVASRPSDMSFAVSDDRVGIEWSGSSPASIFAQPRNLARPAFVRMLSDVVRFNRAARALLEGPDDADLTLEEFLARGRWSSGFRDWYLIPMGAAIWSADPSVFTEFPAHAFARFFHNHGLLGLGGRPEWRTIVGGSQRYVRAVLDPLGDRVRLGVAVASVSRHAGGVRLTTTQGETGDFDHVVLATHSDQALRLLSEPTRAEREILSAIRYRANVATLHTDPSLLARRERARASWNWHRRLGTAESAPTLTYDLSRLQGLATSTPVCLTLNAPDAVAPEAVIWSRTYWHPVFDAAAMRAQRRHHEISGRDGLSFAGAYWGYGFHEDGARSAMVVCDALDASTVSSSTAAASTMSANEAVGAIGAPA
jgi:predicted NAD/FAD-binding protein